MNVKRKKQNQQQPLELFVIFYAHQAISSNLLTLGSNGGSPDDVAKGAVGLTYVYSVTRTKI